MTARGIRDNNPGNLRPGALAWQGELMPENNYCVFDTPENGIRAMAKNLLAYQSKHYCKTIRQIINRWAPPSDNNDTEAYVAVVSADVGIAADALIGLSDASVLSSMLMAIVSHENGSLPWDVLVFERAASIAVGDGLEW